MKPYKQKAWLFQKYIIEKLSCYEIAPLAKVHPDTIHTWLKRLKIKTRPIREALKLMHRKRERMAIGTKRIHVSGYIMIFNPNHPRCNSFGFIMEHRLVMEKELGRYLTLKERVHHKNEIKHDNKPENLELFESNNKHLNYHKKLIRESQQWKL